MKHTKDDKQPSISNEHLNAAIKTPMINKLVIGEPEKFCIATSKNTKNTKNKHSLGFPVDI